MGHEFNILTLYYLGKRSSGRFPHASMVVRVAAQEPPNGVIFAGYQFTGDQSSIRRFYRQYFGCMRLRSLYYLWVEQSCAQPDATSTPTMNASC